MQNIKSTLLKTKEFMTYLCGCHGNLVIIATMYVADTYCPKEAPCQIWSQYNLRQRSYKIRKLMSPFQLAKRHGTTSCHRKHLLLLKAPFVIETISCYRRYYLFLETPLAIETTSCYRKHRLLSKDIFVRLRASYRTGFWSAQVIVQSRYYSTWHHCPSL